MHVNDTVIETWYTVRYSDNMFTSCIEKLTYSMQINHTCYTAVKNIHALG